MADVIKFPGNDKPAIASPVVQSSTEAAKLGSCQASAADIIRRGRAVLDGLESNLVALDQVSHLVWEEGWHDLILALGAGRNIALLQASTDKPYGCKYRNAIGVWLRCHGFDRIGEADRSRLLKCFDNLEEINAWRSALPAEQRAKLNHPRTVLAHWQRWRKSQLESETQSPPGSKPDTPTITIDIVLAWLSTASLTDKRKVAAALAQDTAAMREILPAKMLPVKASDKQIYDRAMGLLAVDEASVPEAGIRHAILEDLQSVH